MVKRIRCYCEIIFSLLHVQSCLNVCLFSNLQTPTQDSYRLMSMALTFDKIANHSSAFIPMSLASSFGRKPGPSIVLPHLNYKVKHIWHGASFTCIPVWAQKGKKQQERMFT